MLIEWSKAEEIRLRKARKGFSPVKNKVSKVFFDIRDEWTVSIWV